MSWRQGGAVELDEAFAVQAPTCVDAWAHLVFGADRVAAQAVAERLDTGSVGINFFASNHDAPFGGRHDSGLGVEYGVEGLAAYISYQSVHRR